MRLLNQSRGIFKSMDKWYLNLTKPPAISRESINYISSIKPHTDKQWDKSCKKMDTYKQELLSKMLINQNNRCAYCGLSLIRELVDREHFAPKAKHPYFTFEPFNLLASCAYCNRRMKASKEVIKRLDKADYKKCEFNIVHPYFDNTEDCFYFEECEPGYPILFKLKDSTDKRAKKTMEMFLLNSSDLATKRAGYIKEQEMKVRLQKNPQLLNIVSYTK